MIRPDAPLAREVGGAGGGRGRVGSIREAPAGGRGAREAGPRAAGTRGHVPQSGVFAEPSAVHASVVAPAGGRRG